MTGKKKMKGLICEIFEDKAIGNCSNNGISKHNKDVLLIGEGIEGPFEESEDRPTVILEKRQINGWKEPYLTIYPKDKGEKWYMFGGCFIYTSDSRFPAKYPIPLHDRVE